MMSLKKSRIVLRRRARRGPAPTHERAQDEQGAHPARLRTRAAWLIHASQSSCTHVDRASTSEQRVSVSRARGPSVRGTRAWSRRPCGASSLGAGAQDLLDVARAAPPARARRSRASAKYAEHPVGQQPLGVDAAGARRALAVPDRLVVVGLKKRCSWQTLHTSGRPGSVRWMRCVSVTMLMTCFRIDVLVARRSRWRCRATWTSC